MEWIAEDHKARLIQKIQSRGVTDPRVMAAFAKVHREDFITEQQRPMAYADRPLPIDEEQTISQPYLVALMSQILELKPMDHVLEVGTGSGYQTAILAELALKVFTIEVRPTLATKARSVLEKLGYSNIEFSIGDGTLGWPEKAPYDAIMVTAAAPLLPEALLRQLKEGGRLLIPLDVEDGQELFRFRKLQGSLEVRSLGPVRFVPMISV